MNDKQLAEIIVRSLLAIVAAIRKRYDLPAYHNVTISMTDTATPPPIYDTMTEIK